MSVLRIVYGMPGPALITDADAGRVILGGCCIEPGQPNRQCTACGWNDGTHGRDDD